MQLRRKSVRPQDIFEVCYERYLAIRRSKDWTVVSARMDVPVPSSGYSWRPDRVKAADYAADFERTGRRVLARSTWKGRKRLFETYFLQQIPYKRAITLVGVSPGTFDWWVAEVKKSIGLELRGAGLFPPTRYFQASEYSSAATTCPMGIEVSSQAI
jgi:hypothetical protein